MYLGVCILVERRGTGAEGSSGMVLRRGLVLLFSVCIDAVVLLLERCLLGPPSEVGGPVFGVALPSPSEGGFGIFGDGGILPGVFFRVFRVCTLGVCRRVFGSVGDVDVCARNCCVVASLSVTVLNIVANFWRASRWRLW